MYYENSVLDSLNNSLGSNQLDKFILGEDKYSFPNNFIEVPTDLNTIFIQGFNEYIKKNGRDSLTKEITEALVLLTKDPIGLWWSIIFIYNYLFTYFEGALLFHFDITKVINTINNHIKPAKEILNNNQSFVGYRFTEGLWRDTQNMVIKINARLKEDGFKIELSNEK